MASLFFFSFLMHQSFTRSTFSWQVTSRSLETTSKTYCLLGNDLVLILDLEWDEEPGVLAWALLKPYNLSRLGKSNEMVLRRWRALRSAR